MTELSKKEIAIKVAEKRGYYEIMFNEEGEIEYFVEGGWERIKSISDFLKDEAAEIIFSKGMVAAINGYLFKDLDASKIDCFWLGDETGTLTPRKILEVYLDMEG